MKRAVPLARTAWPGSGLPVTEQAAGAGEDEDAGDARHRDRRDLSDSGGAQVFAVAGPVRRGHAPLLAPKAGGLCSAALGG